MSAPEPAASAAGLLRAVREQARAEREAVRERALWELMATRARAARERAGHAPAGIG